MERADEAAAEAARLAAAEKYARLKAAADKAAIVRKKTEAEHRAELAGLKLSELKKRAAAIDDVDDPNAAAIELLTQQWLLPRSGGKRTRSRQRIRHRGARCTLMHV